MEVWWTKTSSPPSSGTMKPNPFFTSNHFTVPLDGDDPEDRKATRNAYAGFTTAAPPPTLNAFAVVAVVAVDFVKRNDLEALERSEDADLPNIIIAISFVLIDVSSRYTSCLWITSSSE